MTAVGGLGARRALLSTAQALLATGLAFIVPSCATAELTEVGEPPAQEVATAGAGGSRDSAVVAIGASGSSRGGAGPSLGGGFTVPPNAAICDETLPFKVPGCGCSGPQTVPCWTGPADKRNVGQCHDGLQRCVNSGELYVWGACEGEEFTCETGTGGEPDPGDPANEPCKCKPGTTIGCSEDCEALIVCSLSGYKTCQPDGTWGMCRETNDLSGAIGNLLGCRNVFNGCFPGNEEGLYSGDCSSVFTCGHVPGAPQ